MLAYRLWQEKLNVPADKAVQKIEQKLKIPVYFLTYGWGKSFDTEQTKEKLKG